ncbi:MAG: hypothetical protein R2816_08180 [Flavobacteriaceae bacterium]|nr:hypothetical protein [Flavobacteriaceae bacterium]
MKFIHRLGYYLGGFSIGLIFLAFFLSGKRASCDYGPDARVLKNIGLKQLQYAENVEAMMNSNVIDSTIISMILKQGDVNFSESNTKLETCKIYVVEKTVEDKEIALTVENCEQIATVKNISIK